MNEPSAPIRYAGFWIRLAANLIDTALFVLLTAPLLFWIYGGSYDPLASLLGQPAGWADLLISNLLPIPLAILFWRYRSATPGKMVLKLAIVDAETLGAPGTKQLLIRYAGYFVCAIPFGYGFIKLGSHPRKQGWHDRMANTLVIYSP